LKISNKILSEALEKSGLTKSQIAIKTGYNRSTIYRHLDDENLDPAIYLRYGRAINHDFSDKVPALVNMHSAFAEPISNYGVNSIADALKQRDFWKDKYITLLENYNELMKKYYDDKELESH
jgi:hypothetical protein